MERVVCPYCTAEIEQVSRDHIFPDFLGGTRTIASCATCNNQTFGSRFEAKAARQLLAFQLMLSSTGLSTIRMREGSRWVRAYEHQGEMYDLECREGKPVLVLSEPKVIRDEKGNVISVKVRSVNEAKRMSRGKGKTYAVTEYSEAIRFDIPAFSFEFGPDFGRVVLKMCAALSTLMPGFRPLDLATVIPTLRSDETEVSTARTDFRALPEVERRLRPLSHAIYVERNACGLHGLVVLFGAIRMYCVMAPKSAGNKPEAFLGTLDASSGAEAFSQIDPQGLTEAPFVLTAEDRRKGIESWMGTLKRHLSDAGAGELSVAGTFPPRHLHTLWQSSTVTSSSVYWSGNSPTPRVAPRKK